MAQAASQPWQQKHGAGGASAVSIGVAQWVHGRAAGLGAAADPAGAGSAARGEAAATAQRASAV